MEIFVIGIFVSIALIFAWIALDKNFLVFGAAASIILILLGILIVNAGNIERTFCFTDTLRETSTFTYDNKTISTFTPQIAENMTEITIIDGNNHSGNLDSIGKIDQNYFIINETTGAPGYDVRFDSSFELPRAHISFFGRVDNGQGGDATIELLIRESNTWDAVIIISASATDQWTNITISDTSLYTSGGNAVALRLHHTSPGNPTHSILTDLFQIHLMNETKVKIAEVDVEQIVLNKVNTVICEVREFDITDNYKRGIGWVIVLAGIGLFVSMAINEHKENKDQLG